MPERQASVWAGVPTQGQGGPLARPADPREGHGVFREAGIVRRARCAEKARPRGPWGLRHSGSEGRGGQTAVNEAQWCCVQSGHTGPEAVL